MDIINKLDKIEENELTSPIIDSIGYYFRKLDILQNGSKKIFEILNSHFKSNMDKLNTHFSNLSKKIERYEMLTEAEIKNLNNIIRNNNSIHKIIKEYQMLQMENCMREMTIDNIISTLETKYKAHIKIIVKKITQKIHPSDILEFKEIGKTAFLIQTSFKFLNIYHNLPE